MRYWLPAVLVAGVIASTPALAQVNAQQLVTQGNGRGATACASCHQANGAGQAQAGFPRLAGINADYLVSQIEAFKNGTRKNPTMEPIAKALSPEEARAVAAYFAQQKIPVPPAPQVSPEVLQRGERLATRGHWRDKNLPACIQCHGPNGEGVGGDFPMLAGQHASYIQAQLEAYKNGTRKSDPLALMRTVAEKLSAEDMQAVAAYFAGLPAGGPATAGKPAAK